MAEVLYGKPVAEREYRLLDPHITPKLAIVQVGHVPASDAYVNSIIKSCDKHGVNWELIAHDEDISEGKLVDTIKKLNADKSVDGIIVQRPLPSQCHYQYIAEHIHPLKDVDCVGSENMGHIMTGETAYIPATPLAIMRMMAQYNISVRGKHVVVVGRSNTVGKPIGMLMLQKTFDATVTFVHTGTENLSDITRQADILIVAIGKPKFIKADMIKEGAIIFDVGINEVDGKIVGDVDFMDVVNKASAITPVPGGVGPVATSVLIYNTFIQASVLH